jgi:hypothetical protein
MDSTGIDTNSDPYHFLMEQLVANYGLIDDGSQAIRGSRSHIEGRVGLGLVDVSGPIFMHPTPDELDTLLPRILGAAESTDTFALAETLPSFLVAIDRVARVHTYATCYVNKATLSGKTGGKVQLKLDIIGTSEALGAAGSFPSLTFSTQKPYEFHEGVLTLGGSTYVYNEFVLVIDNHLERVYNNSTEATCIEAADRTVHFATSTPWTSSETGIYTTRTGSGAAPIRTGLTTNTLVFTNGGISTAFSMGNVKLFAKSPSVPGKKEIRLPLYYKAYKTGSTNEIEVTNDPVA